MKAMKIYQSLDSSFNPLHYIKDTGDFENKGLEYPKIEIYGFDKTCPKKEIVEGIASAKVNLELVVQNIDKTKQTLENYGFWNYRKFLKKSGGNLFKLSLAFGAIGALFGGLYEYGSPIDLSNALAVGSIYFGVTFGGMQIPCELNRLLTKSIAKDDLISLNKEKSENKNVCENMKKAEISFYHFDEAGKNVDAARRLVEKDVCTPNVDTINYYLEDVYKDQKSGLLIA